MSERAGRPSSRAWFFYSVTPVFLGALLGSQRGTRDRVKANTGSRREPPAFYCTNPQRTSTVQGNPHVAAVPVLQSVSLHPNSGGLTVSFKFRKPIVFAPEGVYISWSVFLYRHHGDASNYEGGVRLQFQDRGKGWQPTGWTILAVVGSTNNLLSGQVHTNHANNELTTFFPGGLANLRPPFLLVRHPGRIPGVFAGEQPSSIAGLEGLRSMLFDCPAGVRSDPDSSPYAARLLTAGA